MTIQKRLDFSYSITFSCINRSFS